MNKAHNLKGVHGGTIAGSILTAAQFVISLVLILLILRVGVLPADILAITAFIIMMLAALTLTCVYLGRRRKALRITSYFIGTFLTISFIVISGFMYKSDAFIRDVGNGAEERFGVSVIVPADSIYTDLEQLEGKTFGYVRRNESVDLKEGVNEIKTILGPLETIHPANTGDLADRLLGRECDAAVIEESARSLITEGHEDFDTRTRVIWNHETSRKIDSEGSSLDVTQDPFIIFLCGSDSRESVDEAALNDLNMIVTVNPNTEQILLTSIPRDYFIELPSYGAKDKLTHAGVYGTEESVRAVEKLTGLKMDFYVKVSFAALVYVVDAMGGIDVDSDTDFIAWTNPDVHIKKGINHMDGVTALAYARERYAYEDGDIHRAQNQAQVLREVAWRAMSPGILPHYDKLLDALEKGMKTSMSDEQIKSLIRMQLGRKAQWGISDYQMNGEGTTSDECYSMWGQELFVMEPDMDTVTKALGYINEFMEGEIPADE